MLGQCDKHTKRDKFTLMTEILKNTTVPVKKTHLLYKTGINFHQLDRYLNLLLSVGFIQAIVEPINGYQITQKGMVFLGLFDNNQAAVTSRSVIEAMVEK